MNTDKKITCLIVTYNRKHLLERLINRLDELSTKPNIILIIDNNSNDGTDLLIKSHMKEAKKIKFDIEEVSSAIDGFLNSTRTVYVNNKYNGGGSLGFNIGARISIEELNSDYIWMMDDDGLPEKESLNALIKYLPNHFLSSLVISEENTEELAFGFEKYKKVIDVSNIKLIYGLANPFNSILVSRSAIKKAGYPRSDFFIYGDENEFQMRLRNHGIFPTLVTDSRHIHPKNRQTEKTILKVLRYKEIRGELRKYCYFRNTMYNIFNYQSKVMAAKWAAKLITIMLLKGDWRGLKIFIEAAYESKAPHFIGHQKYMENMR